MLSRVLAAALAVSALLASPASAAAAPTTVTIYRDIAGTTDPATYSHPSSFRLNSEDSFVVFRHLRWRRWGSATAWARGRARTCGSGGPEGYVCHSGRVRLVAGQRADCGDGHIYLTLVAYRIPDYGPKLEIPISATGCPSSWKGGERRYLRRAPLPKMLYPTLDYGSRDGGTIWHRWIKPRGWSDGDDVLVRHARWLSWNRQRAVARVRVVIGGQRGRGRVVLSDPGFCPAAHAFGYLRETDRGGLWGPGATIDLHEECDTASPDLHRLFPRGPS